MSEWEITYTSAKKTIEKIVIRAETYTMALLNFITKYPKLDYREVRELKCGDQG